MPPSWVKAMHWRKIRSSTLMNRVSSRRATVKASSLTIKLHHRFDFTSSVAAPDLLTWFEVIGYTVLLSSDIVFLTALFNWIDHIVRAPKPRPYGESSPVRVREASPLLRSVSPWEKAGFPPAGSGEAARMLSVFPTEATAPSFMANPKGYIVVYPTERSCKHRAERSSYTGLVLANRLHRSW